MTNNPKGDGKDAKNLEVTKVMMKNTKWLAEPRSYKSDLGLCSSFKVFERKAQLVELITTKADKA